MSKAALIGIFFNIILLFCCLGVYCYIKRKKEINQQPIYSESEKRYLEIVKLRKEIRMNKFDDEKVEGLNKKLNELKLEYVKDFMALLESCFFDSQSGTFLNHECVICMESYVQGDELRQIPLCHHSVHVQCCQNWYMGKNQEKEQRCPLCNVIIEYETLKKIKETLSSKGGGSGGTA